MSPVSREPAPPGSDPAPFALHYLDRSGLQALCAAGENLLGVVGYGAKRPDFLPACPFVAAPLAPASGEAMFEIWTAAAPLRPAEAGSVRGAYNDAIAFGRVTLAEADGLEAAAERAYQEIFDFLDATGHSAPIRFWNYPLGITEDENGMERYRRFNTGRHRAFSARLRQSRPPAASGVGGHAGESVIYFLAAREPAQPVENPRQVSAYDYPPVYGPRSPSFSRAAVFTHQARSCLFISGTASITGHESQHIGDLAGQIAETAENLRAVIGAAEAATAVAPRGAWALKIYLHDPGDLAAVAPVADAVFGAEASRLYLRGDICRRELLVEIEAFRQF